jgi:PAS domain S-box-containing protein
MPSSLHAIGEAKMSPAKDGADSVRDLDRAEARAGTAKTGGETYGRDGGTSGLYTLLVEGVQDYAIFALDPEGRVLSWNAGARRLKGYEPSEIIGRHFSVFYSPEEIAAGKPERELEEAADKGWVEDEGWRIRKDGSRFWANVVLTSLHDDSGKLIGYAKVTRDLTERRRAEEALRATEERFRLLIEAVKDYAIIMLDTEGRVASWNAGAQAILGYAGKEILGRHFSIFYQPADVEAGRPERELRIAEKEGRYEEEGWRVRKDGSTFWSSIVVTPIRGVDGALVGFAKITRDLTERRAAEERAIADARRITRIETASRTKSEFLSALSHELRT